MATTLAERMNKFSGSPTSALIAKVAELKRQGKDIISLNVGEPDFGTPDYIKVAGMKAIADNFTKYTPGNGILELRQEIVKKLREDNGVEYALNEVTTAVGAKQAIASAMMVLAGPGDEVLLPIPCWVSYTEMIRLAGATPVFVPVREDNYELDLDAIEKAITPRTKAILLNNPSNPTGMMYDREELEAIAAVCTQADIYVISDEIYACLAYDGRTFTSFASLSADAKERTILVNGVSKAYAMTGWRIGYACANDVIAKVMANYVSHSTGSPVAISQRAAAVALSGSQAEIETMRQAFEQRRNYIVERMNAIPGVSCIQPEGAFYVMMNLEQLLGKTIHGVEITNDDVFADAFLKYGLVAVVPGSGFGAPNFVRWSYATSIENIKEGLNRLERFLKGETI